MKEKCDSKSNLIENQKVIPKIVVEPLISATTYAALKQKNNQIKKGSHLNTSRLSRVNQSKSRNIGREAIESKDSVSTVKS